MGMVELEGLRIHYHAAGDPVAGRGQRVRNTRAWLAEQQRAAKAESIRDRASSPPLISLDGCG